MQHMHSKWDEDENTLSIPPINVSSMSVTIIAGRVSGVHMVASVDNANLLSFCFSPLRKTEKWLLRLVVPTI